MDMGEEEAMVRAIAMSLGESLLSPEEQAEKQVVVVGLLVFQHIFSLFGYWLILINIWLLILIIWYY